MALYPAKTTSTYMLFSENPVKNAIARYLKLWKILIN